MKKGKILKQAYFLLAMVLGGIFVIFSSVTPAFAAKKPIKIGVLLARTGHFASLTTYVIDGFNVAIESVNHKVAGRDIKVIIEDAGPGDPAFAMDKIRKLVESDQVDIILGPFNSDLRIGTLGYTSKKKIPSFAVVCDDEISLRFPYAYAWNQTTFQESRPFGWYAFDELDIKTVNTIGGDWHAGRAFIDGYVQGFTKERGGKVVKQQFAPIGTTDFSSYIVAMPPADAIVVMSVPSDAATFMAQAHSMGVLSRTKILNIGQSIFPSMLKDLGPMLIGNTWQQAETQPLYQGVSNQKFSAQYAAKFGHPPASMEGTGYTTALVVLEALRVTNGSTDPDKLHEAIKALDMDTPLGRLTFTHGNRNKSGVQGIISRFVEVVKKDEKGQYYWDLAFEYKNVKPAPIIK